MLVAVLVGALVGALGGCTDEEPRATAPVTVADGTARVTHHIEPPASPEPRAGVTDPTPFYPSEGPPPRPPELDTADDAGAAAAARYFVEVLNAAGDSGDTSLLSELSDPECSACAGWVSQFAAVAAEEERTGRYWRSGPMTFTWAKAFQEEPGRAWTVDVDFDCAPGDVVDASGAVIEQTTFSGTYHADIDVTYSEGGWLIRSISSELVTWYDPSYDPTAALP